MSFIPPKEVAAAAAKGLKLRKEYGRGGTRIGLNRAHQLANRRPVSEDTIKRMVSFFARHERHKDTPPEEGNGMIAWLLWGGDPGREWATAIKDGEYEANLTGGLSEGLSPADFDLYDLRKGMAVEMEHTSDPQVAIQIAMDHLVEDPDYYEKLSTLEGHHMQLGDVGLTNLEIEMTGEDLEVLSEVAAEAVEENDQISPYVVSFARDMSQAIPNNRRLHVLVQLTFSEALVLADALRSTASFMDPEVEEVVLDFYSTIHQAVWVMEAGVN